MGTECSIYSTTNCRSFKLLLHRSRDHGGRAVRDDSDTHNLLARQNVLQPKQVDNVSLATSPRDVNLVDKDQDWYLSQLIITEQTLQRNRYTI